MINIFIRIMYQMRMLKQSRGGPYSFTSLLHLGRPEQFKLNNELKAGFQEVCVFGLKSRKRPFLRSTKLIQCPRPRWDKCTLRPTCLQSCAHVCSPGPDDLHDLGQGQRGGRADHETAAPRLQVSRQPSPPFPNPLHRAFLPHLSASNRL